MKTKLRWRFISTKSLHDAIDTEAYLEILYVVDDIKKFFRKHIKRPFHFGDNHLSSEKGGERFYSFYVSKGINHVQVAMKDDGCIYFYFYKKQNNHSELKLCIDAPLQAHDEKTLHDLLELSSHFLCTGNPCLD